MIIDALQSCRELTNVCDPHGRCPRCDADPGIACRGDQGVVCEKCGCELNGEAAHIEATDEVWCHSCADNAAEAAWERHCEAYHDGGSTQFKSLLQQQIEAQKLK